MGNCMSGGGGNELSTPADRERCAPLASDGHGRGELNAAVHRSYAIDKQLEDDARKFKKECKILLLGPSALSSLAPLGSQHRVLTGPRAGSGESGKSTIVKQMKIIHQNGYSRDELLLFKVTVYKNVIDSAQAIVLALRKFRMDPVEPVNRVYADRIMEYRVDQDGTAGLNPDIVRSIDSLWHDPIIPSVLDRGSEFYLMDSAG